MTFMRQELIQDIRNAAGCRPTAGTLYKAINRAVRKQTAKLEPVVSKRKLYYISVEFLLGKMLTSNLIHLYALEDIKALVGEYGCTWKEIQGIEQEPDLDNSNLGGLAAYFLDSIAELNLCGDGIGLYYRFGLFGQRFLNHKQTELPNTQIDTVSWFEGIPVDFQVKLPCHTLQPVHYDMDVIGFDGKRNRLCLFDVESVEEGVVKEGIQFDKTDIRWNLTLFLYPDDNDEQGKLLHIHQQYFMVACSAHMILEEQKQLGYDLHGLCEHAVIQINDTHPSLIISELIYQLMQEGICMKKAVRVVEKMCAYTNYTILAEALETQPMPHLETVIPHLCDILQALDTAADQRYSAVGVTLINADNRTRMAHMDIRFGKSVNKVTALHTEVLRQSELHASCELYPKKFSSKTSGITFTRWLYACNTQLYTYLMELLRMGSQQGERLTGLHIYAQDADVIIHLQDIEQEEKREWCTHIHNKQRVAINPNSIFDTQIKRLHEYKRQQVNALWTIYKLKEIRKGNLPKRPITYIFGAKAAPAYMIVKGIIHVLLCLRDIIEHDARVSPYLQVCFTENYNVNEAELIIPTSDMSEQISPAGRGASGTGNMKFMLNGALTLGTRGNADMEVADLVEEDNIYIFRKSSGEVIAYYEKTDCYSRDYYEQDALLQKLVDYLIGEEMLVTGDRKLLHRFYWELLSKDWFVALLDTKEYIACKEQMLKDYEDRKLQGRKMLRSIACSSFLSNKRTIGDYDRDIWNLEQGESWRNKLKF